MKAHINLRQEPLTKILYKKTNFKKSGLFHNGFYGQDIVMAFLPPEYCRLFAQKKAYQGGVTGTPGPPLATPLVRTCHSLKGHLDAELEPTSVFCRIALRECFGDVIPFSLSN